MRSAHALQANKAPSTLLGLAKYRLIKMPDFLDLLSLTLITYQPANTKIQLHRRQLFELEQKNH